MKTEHGAREEGLRDALASAGAQPPAWMDLAHYAGRAGPSVCQAFTEQMQTMSDGREEREEREKRRQLEEREDRHDRVDWLEPHDTDLSQPDRHDSRLDLVYNIA